MLGEKAIFGRDEALAEIVASRRKQLGFRLAITALILVFYGGALGFALSAMWAGAYLSTQLFELVVGLTLIKRPRGWRRTLILVSMGLSATAFGSLSPLCYSRMGNFGLVCGAFILAGGILTTLQSTSRCGAAFAAISLPYFIYALSTPLLVLVSKAPPALAITLAPGAVMMIFCTIQVWRQARQAAIAEAVALAGLRRSEALARANEEFLDVVVDNIPAMLVVKHAADGRYRMVNKAAEATIGRMREQMIGRIDHDIFTAEEADAFVAGDRAVLAAGRPIHLTGEFVETPRGRRELDTHKAVLHTPSGADIIVIMCKDVSDERANARELTAAVEQARAASRAKGEFLANMSHEIRTPLNGVVALADMLARADLPPKAREMAEIIRSSGDTLQRLLSDILDMARIESGKIAIEIAPFELGEMVRAAAALSQLKCEEKCVRLVVEVAPEAEGMVVGDVIRVRQVITNLLSNATKFTDRGEIRLQVERPAEGLVRFAVSDTGVGFSMDDKAKVLGRFEQADSSITRRFGGTGLGLSICCDLARLMGGELDCESAPGVGSRFWMVLPLARAEAQALAGAPVTAAPDLQSRPLRILLADDHPTNRKVVQLMLEDVQAELTCVEDGAQALEAFRAGAFDLILMDMQMPVMDGLTAIAEIRRMEPAIGVARTPVVMLTANALPEHVASATSAGADLHLAKPFTTEDLFGAIAAALSLGEAETAAA